MSYTNDQMPCAFKDILGYQMAYSETGTGDPIVFLHGNPTCRYLWRNIIPHVQDLGRCIAPDLIGMGDSDKLPVSEGADRYSFPSHARYLDALLDALDVDEKVTLVIHDWGSALGFHWANRNRDRVKAICYMEGIVKPVESWDDWPERARPTFQNFRSDAGEAMVIEKNVFVERVLPAAMVGQLPEEAHAVYKAPFLEAGEDRRPTLSWPREIPIAGEPAHMVEIVGAYAEWMADNSLCKLFINAEPGSILVGPQRDFCRGWKNQTEVTVVGDHFIQEDSYDEIGQALRSWMLAL